MVGVLLVYFCGGTVGKSIRVFFGEEISLEAARLA